MLHLRALSVAEVGRQAERGSSPLCPAYLHWQQLGRAGEWWRLHCHSGPCNPPGNPSPQPGSPLVKMTHSDNSVLSGDLQLPIKPNSAQPQRCWHSIFKTGLEEPWLTRMLLSWARSGYAKPLSARGQYFNLTFVQFDSSLRCVLTNPRYAFLRLVPENLSPVKLAAFLQCPHSQKAWTCEVTTDL